MNIRLLLVFVLLSFAAKAEETLHFIHTDHLGTPIMLTDMDQNVVWKVESQTPFGEMVVNEDPDGDGNVVEFDLRFPGQYFDRETNTNYNYHRNYDPSLGRYIQSDPIGLGDGPNTYSYVHNNPIIFIDPLGLECRVVRGRYRCLSNGADFDQGFMDYFRDLTEPLNPYDPETESCLYGRRQAAIGAAQAALAVAASHRDQAFDMAMRTLSENRQYVAGRAAANAIVGLGAGGLLAASGGSAGAVLMADVGGSLIGATGASANAAIRYFESLLWECECEQ